MVKAKPQVNPRKAALDKISGKLAQFVVTETYRDEQEAQALLADAIRLIDRAAELLVQADTAAEVSTSRAILDSSAT